MLAILKLDAMTQQAAFPEVVDEYTAGFNSILQALDDIFPRVLDAHQFKKRITVGTFYLGVLDKITEIYGNMEEERLKSGVEEELNYNLWDEDCYNVETLKDYRIDLFIERMSDSSFYKSVELCLFYLIQFKANYLQKNNENAGVALNNAGQLLDEINDFYENYEEKEIELKVKAAVKSREPYEIAKNELIRILSQYPAEVFKSKIKVYSAIKDQFLEFTSTRNNGKPKSSNYEKILGRWSTEDENVNAAFTRVLKNKKKHQSAEQLDEASQARAEGLFNQLKVRNIHPEILKFCHADFLRNHYQDAVSGAAEYICERLRNMTGLSLDGMALINECFSETDPVVTVNELYTEAECDEQEGVMLLFKGALLAISNIADDESGSVWKEEDVADYFTLLSMLIRKLKTAQVIKF
ncbi:TIGR02391 family protein [Scandinavium sp.]|uniref:TIGR02391 family protein n=1 Tax=Scandinavium sp. TaxID=2830653 RepID=UPI00289AF52D|nr:TIGR02391 family protein [Scandinavium sp.]